MNVQIVMNDLLETVPSNVTSLRARLEWGRKKEERSFMNARYVIFFFVVLKQTKCTGKKRREVKVKSGWLSLEVFDFTMPQESISPSRRFQ